MLVFWWIANFDGLLILMDCWLGYLTEPCLGEYCLLEWRQFLDCRNVDNGEVREWRNDGTEWRNDRTEPPGTVKWVLWYVGGLNIWHPGNGFLERCLEIWYSLIPTHRTDCLEPFSDTGFLWNNSLEKWFSGKDSLERGCYENNSQTCGGCPEKGCQLFVDTWQKKKFILNQVKKAGNECQNGFLIFTSKWWNGMGDWTVGYWNGEVVK